MAFTEGFDTDFVQKKHQQMVLRRRIPSKMLTGSRSLFDVITKNTSTTVRRLMIDISAACEAYGRLDISSSGIVRSAYNAVEAFTKARKCEALN